MGDKNLDLVECIEARKSVRGFTDEDVPNDFIIELVRLGNLAPSAGNFQARDFIIVKNKDSISKITEASVEFTREMAGNHQEFIRNAPVIIVCCANFEKITKYQKRGIELYCIQDVAAAVENMLLCIVNSGYASCWIGGFDEVAVSKILDLPSHIRPVAMLPIGLPTKDGRQRTRIDTKEIMHFEKW